MNKISLKGSEIDRLKLYPTGSIMSTESKIYYYKHYDSKNLLIKKLYLTDKDIFKRKIDTLEDINSSELSNFEELVIPEDLVVVRGKNIGFTIREITDSTNLGLILNDPKVSIEKKILLLKKIGELLNKTMSCDKEFYINDLQPFNFLVDKDDNIRVVDLDSSATNSNNPLISFYMTLDKKNRQIDKYHVTDDGLSYPDKNSDLFCYNMMILNTISGNNIYRLNFEEFYNYLYYLSSIGMNSDLVESFATLYENKDNTNPVDYLSNINNESLYRSNYNIYKLNKKR